VSGAVGVSLICCDLAGLVIHGSVTERAFAEAIAAQGIVSGTQSYTRAMVKFDHAHGRPPADVMRDLFIGNDAQATVATLAFDQSFRAAAERFAITAPSEFVDALAKFSGTDVRVCLLTTLSHAACGPLAAQIRQQSAVDLVLCADDAPRGFPWPDLVLTAALRAGAGDVREVAVVSATESGVRSGRRAGAGMVVGIADGARHAAALQEAGATHVASGIDAIPGLVLTSDTA
jgi:beta-phosphoglucomutase-like phosphatase (HAD superfamily)